MALNNISDFLLLWFPFLQLPAAPPKLRESRTKLLFKATISLTAILVGHDVSSSGPGVGAKNHAILIYGNTIILSVNEEKFCISDRFYFISVIRF